MKLSAGDFKKKVVFQQPTTTINEEGGPEKTYTEFLTTWAYVAKWDQKRVVELGKADLLNTKMIYVRYRAALAPLGVGWKVTIDGKDYTIDSKPEIKESGLKVFEITCKAK